MLMNKLWLFFPDKMAVIGRVSRNRGQIFQNTIYPPWGRLWKSPECNMGKWGTYAPHHHFMSENTKQQILACNINLVYCSTISGPESVCMCVHPKIWHRNRAITVLNLLQVASRKKNLVKGGQQTMLFQAMTPDCNIRSPPLPYLKNELDAWEKMSLSQPHLLHSHLTQSFTHTDIPYLTHRISPTLACLLLLSGNYYTEMKMLTFSHNRYHFYKLYLLEINIPFFSANSFFSILCFNITRK